MMTVVRACVHACVCVCVRLQCVVSTQPTLVCVGPGQPRWGSPHLLLHLLCRYLPRVVPCVPRRVSGGTHGGRVPRI